MTTQTRPEIIESLMQDIGEQELGVGLGMAVGGRRGDGEPEAHQGVARGQGRRRRWLKG